MTGKHRLARLAATALLVGLLAGCGSSDTEEATTDVAAETEAVLAQEARWLTAITSGDRETVESILSSDFKHINSEGKLLDRAQEVDSIVKVSFTMNPTDQVVDVVGDTAVIHGVNTLMEGPSVIARERFTDVFVKQDGTWMALSAQETAIE